MKTLALLRIIGSMALCVVGLASHVLRGDEELPKNIILIISDQESYHLNAPDSYQLHAREELKSRGVTFTNHYTAAAMCTPSRGVLFSGQPPQVNGVFDQMELGYVPSLPVDRPSMGTIFRKLGYATAYFGKFELVKDLIKPTDQVNYTESLQRYGFQTFPADGDKTGAPDQGYDTDVYTVGVANRWLRTHAQQLNAEGKPWLLVVSLINPHDIMYTDANQAGELVQVSKAGGTLTPPAENTLYDRQWHFDLYPSLDEPLDGPGRPNAQLQYQLGWTDWVGVIPTERRDMWTTFYNCYLNLIQDNDKTLQTMLTTMSELGLWSDTAVILTADHGELAGSHGGLRGKGPFAYEPMAHIPFIVVDPDNKDSAGQSCEAVTSSIDLLPTMIGLTGLGADQRKELAHELPGHDLSVLLQKPEEATIHTARPAVLFNYVGIQLIDADYFIKIAPEQAKDDFVPPLSELAPDLSKRGLMSFVFDGRYKYARYYAPNHFNVPTTIGEIFANNDIELFDLETDPDEVVNLALDRQRNAELILKMNALLNDMIAKEVGVNNGAFLPTAVRPAGVN